MCPTPSPEPFAVCCCCFVDKRLLGFDCRKRNKRNNDIIKSQPPSLIFRFSGASPIHVQHTTICESNFHPTLSPSIIFRLLVGSISSLERKRNKKGNVEAKKSSRTDLSLRLCFFSSSFLCSHQFQFFIAHAKSEGFKLSGSCVCTRIFPPWRFIHTFYLRQTRNTFQAPYPGIWWVRKWKFYDFFPVCFVSDDPLRRTMYLYALLPRPFHLFWVIVCRADFIW